MRAAWSALEDYLRGFAYGLSGLPRAILIISGHWEEDQPTDSASAATTLLFDYDGFSEHTSTFASSLSTEVNPTLRLWPLMTGYGTRC